MNRKPKPYVDNFLLEKIIRDDAYLTREERFFLLLLKTYRHVYTLDCNPQMAWLVGGFRKTDRTIRRLVHRLEEKDYLVSVRRGFDYPNHYYFAADFRAALIAYHCPLFQGNKMMLAKANRKRWVVKTGQNVQSSSDTQMSTLNNKIDTIRLTKVLYDDTYQCPHCSLSREKENS